MSRQDPGDRDYDARLQADIARMQAAKGIQLGAWMRANKTLVVIFAVYIVAVIGAGIAFQNPGASIAAVFVVPLVALRIYVRMRR